MLCVREMLWSFFCDGLNCEDWEGWGIKNDFVGLSPIGITFLYMFFNMGDNLDCHNFDGENTLEVANNF